MSKSIFSGFGRFLSLAKLETLLEANDLSIAALVDGAHTKIDDLLRRAAENQEITDDLLAKVAYHQGVVNGATDRAHDIETALAAFGKALHVDSL